MKTKTKSVFKGCYDEILRQVNKMDKILKGSIFTDKIRELVEREIKKYNDTLK